MPGDLSEYHIDVTKGSATKPDDKRADEKFCFECGAVIRAKAEICPKCGVRQPGQQVAPTVARNRTTAGLLAIFLGWLGIHKFYLGQGGQGVLYLLFFWTVIPGIIGLIEGIIYLSMTEEAFQQKYGQAR